jgi:thiol:disulfide interchange protein DsbD
VNERIALRDEAVRAAFAAAGVASLTGDWTNGAPAITALLRDHQRDGVPLYLFYPADGSPPQLLPQILTPGMLLRLLPADRKPA